MKTDETQASLQVIKENLTRQLGIDYLQWRLTRCTEDYERYQRTQKAWKVVCEAYYYALQQDMVQLQAAVVAMQTLVSPKGGRK